MGRLIETYNFRRTNGGASVQLRIERQYGREPIKLSSVDSLVRRLPLQVSGDIFGINLDRTDRSFLVRVPYDAREKPVVYDDGTPRELTKPFARLPGALMHELLVSGAFANPDAYVVPGFGGREDRILVPHTDVREVLGSHLRKFIAEHGSW